MPKLCHGSEAEFHSHYTFRSALVCLRGSRTLRRIQRDIKNAEIDIETEEGAI